MKLHLIALALSLLTIPTVGHAASTNGRSGTMPALYDGQTFTVNFKELDDAAAAALLANNKSINTIYMSEDMLPDGSMFVAVLDAIQGDGFNPLWVGVEISFNPGHTPRQLQSDNDVADAEASGEITLSSEGDVYRCAVIGPK